MNKPGFRIAWVMVAVAMAALNLGAIRAVLDRTSRTSYLLGIGAMPMADVLVVGFLIGRRCRRSRRFLAGFVVFGAMALAVYVTVASLFTEDLLNPYLEFSYNVLSAYIRNFSFWMHDLFRATMFGLPQLAFALIGGLIFRKFGTAERQDQDPR